MAGRTGWLLGDWEGLKRLKVKTSTFGQALDRQAMMCYGFIIDKAMGSE